jgi:hypothetical protein
MTKPWILAAATFTATLSACSSGGQSARYSPAAAGPMAAAAPTTHVVSSRMVTYEPSAAQTGRISTPAASKPAPSVAPTARANPPSSAGTVRASGSSSDGAVAAARPSAVSPAARPAPPPFVTPAFVAAKPVARALPPPFVIPAGSQAFSGPAAEMAITRPTLTPAAPSVEETLPEGADGEDCSDGHCRIPVR